MQTPPTYRAYSIVKGSEIHFLTLTVVDWLDVFVRPEFARHVLESLAYCITHKGLQLHAWVLMTSHLHLMASPQQGHDLSAILRDFKKFTARQILTDLTQARVNESRAQAFLNAFGWHGIHNPNNEQYQLWQGDNHAVHVHSRDFAEQKLGYIHQNPVVVGWVEEPWHYRYSSAVDYMTERKGLLPVCLL